LLEAASYILFFMTSEVVVEGFMALAAFFCISYPIAQGLIMYSAHEDRKAVDQMLKEQKKRAEANAQQLAQLKGYPPPAKDKAAVSGAVEETLTDEQRELGRKLIAAAKSAGH
jgi:hypothetical protein